MLIEPISSAEFKDEFNLTEELSVDSILYKICLLASSHYCIATELKYIQSINIFKDPEETSIEKEYQKALGLLSVFLPEKSKLFTHVYEGYLKNCKVPVLIPKPAKKQNERHQIRKFCATPALIERPSLPRQLKKASSISNTFRKRRSKTLSYNPNI